MKLIPPGSTIGIMGGGQLGRMLAMTAARMGYHAHIFTPEKNSPAEEVANTTTVAEYNDEKALRAFAGLVDVVTFEFENIPSKSLELLASLAPVYPEPSLLHMTQHRLREKTFVRDLGIATAPFARIAQEQDIEAAVATVGLPAIMKTAELGYDGKGQKKIATAAEAAHAWKNLGGQEAILEGFVAFEKEVSVIVARNAAGDIRAFPTVENIHRDHILKETIAPAAVSETVAAHAVMIAETIARKSKLISLLAVEMFVAPGGNVLVNELAPRPHNSGHWSLDACVTSQFEQQLRAICGLPLGATDILCPARMINLIGDEVKTWKTYLENGTPARLHLYGKTEIRPGRKMGHVTLLESSQ